MAEWSMKRFWKSASHQASGNGFEILLDGRVVKTPAKAGLIVPTEKMAIAIAQEWDAQVDIVKPDTMPLTRAANAAIDKVSVQFEEVTDLIAAYGETDLLYYRADTPQELVDRQSAAWDVMLDWARDTLGIQPNTGQGVMYVAQPKSVLDGFAKVVKSMTPFQITALHDLVGMSGSLILGLAVAQGKLTGAEAWDLSRIDENWQIEQWGADEDAEEIANRKRTEMLNAERFFQLCL